MACNWVYWGLIIYDRVHNTSFHQNNESVQYNAASAITCAVRRTSKENFFQELGWFRNLCFLIKIFNKQLYFSISPSTKNQILCTKLKKNSSASFKTWLFKTSFFPSNINEWNKNISIFNSSILRFIRSKTNNYSYSHNPKGIRLTTKVCLDLRQLLEHKPKHSFQDLLSSFCLYSNDIEIFTLYLLPALPIQAKEWLFWKKFKV